MWCRHVPSDLKRSSLLAFEQDLSDTPVGDAKRPGLPARYRYFPSWDDMPKGFDEMKESRVLVRAATHLLKTPSRWGRCGGDEVDVGCGNFQELYSDWPDYPTQSMPVGPPL